MPRPRQGCSITRSLAKRHIRRRTVQEGLLALRAVRAPTVETTRCTAPGAPRQKAAWAAPSATRPRVPQAKVRTKAAEPTIKAINGAAWPRSKVTAATPRNGAGKNQRARLERLAVHGHIRTAR